MTTPMIDIKVTYTSIDRVRITRSFGTLAGARKFAAKYVGHHPEIGCGYAVSSDGIGKVTVKGISLNELFRVVTPRAAACIDESVMDEQAIYEAFERAERAAEDAEWAEIERIQRPYRTAGCTCCDQQLRLIGCECPAENPDMPF